jgi:hypothetical protein
MSAYTPTKKQLPSWMMMNDTKHWMTSSDVDMEYSKGQIDDGVNPDELYVLTTSCGGGGGWFTGDDTEYSVCNYAANTYPELNLRHAACTKEARTAAISGRYPRDSLGPKHRMCNMYSQQNKTVYPEYAKCLQPGGMDALDCQKACYTYPNQPGCEAIKAIVDKMTPVQRQKKLKEIIVSEGSILPYDPKAEETVVVAASMRSVTPTAVQFSYVDPKTKKSVVVKKTLVDMYKPTDKVTVVLGKKTNKFVGLQKK